MVLESMGCVSVALNEVVLRSWEEVGWVVIVILWVFCSEYSVCGCLGCYDDFVFVVCLVVLDMLMVLMAHLCRMWC